MATLTIKGCRPAQPPLIFLRRWATIKLTRPRHENLPQELMARRQFIVWKYGLDDAGKPTKHPYTPHATKWKAKSNAPKTWNTFEKALAAADGFNGLGFVLTAEDPWTVVDLDHCRNKVTGVIEPWAREIILKLNSYTEISPSGEGVHIWTRGKVVDTKRKKGKVEIFFSRFYITMTGHHMEGTPSTIEPRQNALEALHKEVFGKPQAAPQPQAPSKAPSGANGLTDFALIDKALAAANGHKFELLWKGDTSAHGGDDSSADFDLCSRLAWWTGGDPGRIDRLFRQSGLYRNPGRDKKWDRPTAGSTYGAITINKALSGKTEFYFPGGPRPDHDQAKEEPKQAVPEAEIDRGLRLTDWGNSERLVALHGQDLRYCHPWKKWLVWDGRRWALDDTGEVERRAKKTVRSIYAEAAAAQDQKLRGALGHHALKSESEAKRKAMMASAWSEPGIPILPGDLDRDPWLLNVLNGTLDLRTGKLRPHSRNDFITKLAPVHFDPKAECPLWWKFLERILPPEIVEFVQKAIGYSATGLTEEEVFFLLHGGGDNGKTTFLETIGGILGDYAKETDPETFMLKKHPSIPNDLAALRGARFVKSVETSGGRRMSEARIKQMTGRDTVTARFLHAEWFDFKPQFKLWLATNHKPIIRDPTHSMWRRVRFIPFEVQVPKEEQDKRLFEKLKEEWPGILNWFVEGALPWQHEGLEPPEAIKQATQNYRDEMDDLGDFLSECCIEDPAERAKSKDLYATYIKWAEDNKEKNPLTQTAFGLALGERGFRRDRGGGGAWYRYGVGLKPERLLPVTS